jgi:hypothetical protein
MILDPFTQINTALLPAAAACPDHSILPTKEVSYALAGNSGFLRPFATLRSNTSWALV